MKRPNPEQPPYRIVDTELMLDNPDRPYSPMRVRDMPVEDKPRERLLKFGPAALSSGELFAVILCVGTKKEDVMAMSNRLLKEYGEKAILNEKDPRRLAKALDLPITKSCQLIACFELGRRLFARSTSGQPVTLRSAKQVYDYLRDMRELPKEHLRGLYLDSHFRLIHDEVISVGSVGANLVHPREVFRPALEHGATAVIVAHNHPSGVVKPSEADIAVTRQLAEAGRILGIHLLDHVVVTRTRFACVVVDKQP
jgi:DNA repair protein RadC